MTDKKTALQSGFAVATRAAKAPLKLDAETTVVFATRARGKKNITTRDDYIAGLSPFDRNAKMKAGRAVSENEFLKFMGSHTLEWTSEERKRIIPMVQDFSEAIKDIGLRWPPEVFLVKTTGDEEGGAAYTRGNTVFLPKDYVYYSDLRWIVFHEFFHVLTRANPSLQEKLYNAIGFEKCNEIDLPATLASRKISNPDAPWNNYFIRVQADGQDHMAVPILLSHTEDYDSEEGASFFTYLQFKLLAVQYENGISGHVVPVCNDQGPILLSSDDVTGFFEKIGKNTEYIIHPEEVLAENFVHMLMKTKKMKSPEIISSIREIIESAKVGTGPVPAQFKPS